MTGRKPFITCHGYVSPCCWLDIPRYNTNGKIRDSNWELVENAFLRPEFNLDNRSYENIVKSDEWLLALEQLHLLNYNPCNMKCSNMLLVNGKVEHDEEELDKAVVSNTLEQSTDPTKFGLNMIDTWDVDVIQMELTNRCSLQCPYCPRQTDKPKKQDLDIQHAMDVINSKHWRIVDDVGNYGDSIFYPDYHAFLEILIDADVDLYLGHIAATGRNQKWWDETIKLYKEVWLSGTNVRIYWGIEGLEDTSRLHRIGQNWDEITIAMRETAKVAESVWQYIPMSFNEHQIDYAQKLAKEWNVEFMIHTSCRFRKGDPNIPKNPKYHRDFYDVR